MLAWPALVNLLSNTFSLLNGPPHVMLGQQVCTLAFEVRRLERLGYTVTLERKAA